MPGIILAASQFAAGGSDMVEFAFDDPPLPQCPPKAQGSACQSSRSGREFAHRGASSTNYFGKDSHFACESRGIIRELFYNLGEYSLLG